MIRIYILFSLCLTALFVFNACSSSETPKQTTSPKAAASESPPLGETVYKKNCVLCHGIKGNLSVAGSIPLTTSTISLEESIEVITNGRGTMIPHKFLGDKKIKAVAAYIEKFKKEE